MRTTLLGGLKRHCITIALLLLLLLPLLAHLHEDGGALNRRLWAKGCGLHVNHNAETLQTYNQKARNQRSGAGILQFP